jgi:hypothetical protein
MLPDDAAHLEVRACWFICYARNINKSCSTKVPEKNFEQTLLLEMFANIS